MCNGLYQAPYTMTDIARRTWRDGESRNHLEEQLPLHIPGGRSKDKKDGSYRVCIGYRRLNKLTVFDPHPHDIIRRCLPRHGEGQVTAKRLLLTRQQFQHIYLMLRKVN
ncbi:transposon ty3-i Gag-Pol polyprotein [Plakobranchus ocellatus]|uniref:Transposon ty3-i Gag-Pol polyprotein n=1 Tax=Plakobranchus ocellatus TaxID=259542 RepID=A0AAV3XZZ3_9GAST|nr:transposon ty3-i Gag-Pol polyprotein [Plakobranchus ocellatus]